MPAIRTANKSFCFYFDQDDKTLLEHAASAVDLTQSEIMRRLIRAYAGGVKIPGLPPCPANKKAAAWVAKFSA